jgi:5'-methylthioadenosine nucleosidase
VQLLGQRLPRVRTGIVTSSNSLDESETDAQMILRSGAQVKEMEAAAVGYVCELARVPVMAVKAITDLVDAHTATADQFTANLEYASDRLRQAIVAILDILSLDGSG